MVARPTPKPPRWRDIADPTSELNKSLDAHAYDITAFLPEPTKEMISWNDQLQKLEKSGKLWQDKSAPDGAPGPELSDFTSFVEGAGPGYNTSAEDLMEEARKYSRIFRKLVEQKKAQIRRAQGGES